MTARTVFKIGRKDWLPPVVLTCVIAVLAVFGYLVGPQVLLAGIVGTAAVVVAFLRPRIVTTSSPLLVPIFLLGGGSIQLGVILLLIVVVFGGLVGNQTSTVIYLLVPVALGAYFFVRELADPTGEFGPYSHFAMMMLGLAALSAAIVAPPNIEWFLFCIATSGLIFSLFAITSGVLTENNRGDDVLGLNANGIAMMAGAGLVAAMTLTLYSHSRLLQASGICLAVLCVGGLVVGQSQGALLGATIGLVVLGWVWRRRSVIVVAGFASLVAFGVFGLGLADKLGGASRADSDLENSRSVRSQVIDQAWDLFLTEPYFGVGRGNASVYINSGWQATPTAPVPIVPHNVFLQVLTMAGIVGFLLCALAVGILLFRRGEPNDRKMLAPILAAFAVFGFTNEWHILISVIVPAVTLGAWAAHRNKPSEVQSTPRPIIPKGTHFTTHLVRSDPPRQVT